MSRAPRSIRRAAFPALVLAALAFGAAQALASPAAAAKRAQSCGSERCDLICVSHGHAGGDCVNGVCKCYDL